MVRGSGGEGLGVGAMEEKAVGDRVLMVKVISVMGGGLCGGIG